MRMRDLGKLIVAEIAQSGHTGGDWKYVCSSN